MDEMEDRLGEEDGAPARRKPGPKPGFRRAVSDERIAGERDYEERSQAEDRELTEDERFELFAASHFQSILPDLPDIPGYHTFWATTTNGRDSVQNRRRLGYTPLLIEECPGWEGISVTAGDYQNVVGVNEMIAMKLPISLYQRYMLHAHHTLPLQEEEKLRSSVDQMRDDLASRGSKVMEGDGMAEEFEMNRAKPQPRFAL